MSKKRPGEEQGDNAERERKQQKEGKQGEIDQKPFHNYKPARRLIILEAIVIALLVILLLFQPNGFSAISIKGTDTVGLLSTSLCFLDLCHQNRADDKVAAQEEAVLPG
jgi:hypothetical protein